MTLPGINPDGTVSTTRIIPTEADVAPSWKAVANDLACALDLAHRVLVDHHFQGCANVAERALNAYAKRAAA